MAVEVVLEARGLVKDYRRDRAVDGVDLVVHAGERVALLGPNGAGKTTTLLMILGVVTPDAGAVTICGFDLAHQRSRAAECVGFAAGLPPAHRADARARVPAPVRAALRHRRPEPADRRGPRAVPHRRPRGRDGYRAVVGTAHAHRDRARRRCTGRACSCSTSRPRRSTPMSRNGCAPACSSCATRRHRVVDDEPRHERRRAGVRAGGVPVARAHRRRRHRPRRSRRLRARRPRRACSSISPNGTSRRVRSRATTREPGHSPPTRLTTRGQVVAAHARDRAPARVRARAQPAPPVRRLALAARRRVAVRFARRVRRHVAARRPPRRRPATCSRASCSGTSSTSRRSR